VVAAVVFAVVTRAGWVLHVDVHRLTSNDSASYLASARAIADHARFFESRSSVVPMFVRTPGYPLFLAGLSVVVGDSVRALAVAVVSPDRVVENFVVARQNSLHRGLLHLPQPRRLLHVREQKDHSLQLSQTDPREADAS
jgi:hypothetical protein